MNERESINRNREGEKTMTNTQTTAERKIALAVFEAREMLYEIDRGLEPMDAGSLDRVIAVLQEAKR